MSAKVPTLLMILPAGLSVYWILFWLQRGGIPIISLVFFILAEIILSLMYYNGASKAGSKEYLELAGWNQWIKITHAVLDTVILIRSILFAMDSSFFFAVYFLIVPYVFARLFSHFFTMAVCRKVLEEAHAKRWITTAYGNLHIILHLIPIADVVSAILVNQKLNQLFSVEKERMSKGDMPHEAL